ncbi:MAG: TfoX family protein [Alphaproteobacteria bacterium]|nr:TfoX family protein [Alphaproteobacteria bacterium]
MPEAGLVAHVLELLEPFGVRARRMFGGVGLYRGELMFALIWQDALYLKTDDTNRPSLLAAGSAPFVYVQRGKKVTMSYYQAPEEALDSAEALRPWAKGALAAAQRARLGKKRSGALAR